MAAARPGICLWLQARRLVTPGGVAIGSAGSVEAVAAEGRQQRHGCARGSCEAGGQHERGAAGSLWVSYGSWHKLGWLCRQQLQRWQGGTPALCLPVSCAMRFHRSQQAAPLTDSGSGESEGRPACQLHNPAAQQYSRRPSQREQRRRRLDTSNPASQRGSSAVGSSASYGAPHQQQQRRRRSSSGGAAQSQRAAAAHHAPHARRQAGGRRQRLLQLAQRHARRVVSEVLQQRMLIH